MTLDIVDDLEAATIASELSASKDRQLLLKMLSGEICLKPRDAHRILARCEFWEQQQMLSIVRSPEDGRHWWIALLLVTMADHCISRRARLHAEGHHCDALLEWPALMAMAIFVMMLAVRYAMPDARPCGLWTLRLIQRYLSL